MTENTLKTPKYTFYVDSDHQYALIKIERADLHGWCSTGGIYMVSKFTVLGGRSHTPPSLSLTRRCIYDTPLEALQHLQSCLHAEVEKTDDNLVRLRVESVDTECLVSELKRESMYWEGYAEAIKPPKEGTDKKDLIPEGESDSLDET